MPKLAAGKWLNVARPLTRRSLRGQVVLVDFWDYSCINCLRTLPYLIRWHGRYAEKGLTIIGIHSPEFRFARVREQVETAVSTHQIPYPILIDNQYENWDRFANKAWPTKYLIDTDGYIRLARRGEGHYREIEGALQLLLRQRDPDLSLPDLLPPLRPEDKPGAVCYRPTPELYAGYEGGGLFGGGLGNPEGYVPHNPTFYKLPEPEDREAGHFYVDGVWRAWPETLAYAGQSGGRIVLPYQAAAAHAVLSPSADPVEIQLKLRPGEKDPAITIKQDGRFLTPENAGPDVLFRDNGASFLRVTRPRLYRLVQNEEYGWHELELTFHAGDLALYAFTFSTCPAPYADPDAPNAFTVA